MRGFERIQRINRKVKYKKIKKKKNEINKRIELIVTALLKIVYVIFPLDIMAYNIVVFTSSDYSDELFIFVLIIKNKIIE